MKAVTKLAVTIMAKTSPIHGSARGNVIVAAYPNTAGFKGSTSFQRPYFVADAAVTSKSDAIRFIRSMEEQGFYF